MFLAENKPSLSLNWIWSSACEPSIKCVYICKEEAGLQRSFWVRGNVPNSLLPGCTCDKEREQDKIPGQETQVPEESARNPLAHSGKARNADTMDSCLIRGAENLLFFHGIPSEMSPAKPLCFLASGGYGDDPFLILLLLFAISSFSLSLLGLEICKPQKTRNKLA